MSIISILLMLLYGNKREFQNADYIVESLYTDIKDWCSLNC